MPMVVQYVDHRPHVFSVYGYLALFEQIKAGGKKHLEGPCVVFMAFLVEAYLNSLGYRFVPAWDSLEFLRWRDKVKFLHGVAGKEVDWGRAPLDFALVLFRKRDKLAHGKPHRVILRECEMDDEIPTMPEDLPPAREEVNPDWYAEINRDWIIQARPKLEALLAYLAGLHGLPANDFQEIGSLGVKDRDKLPKL